jgi:hypothetical protein
VRARQIVNPGGRIGKRVEILVHTA